MSVTKSVKRHPSVQPLSKEHHHCLLLCWKIRTGIEKNIATIRIKKYVDWFYHQYIKAHFEAEEKYVFPVLDKNHEHIKKVTAEHRRLKRLFENDTNIEKSLSLLEEELESHIRFEERILFNEIQEQASELQLKEIENNLHDVVFEENATDEFWK